MDEQQTGAFSSVRFRTDVTEGIIKVLLDKAIVHTKGGYSYFGWKGVDFQCGVCFRSLPKIDLSFASHFLSLVPSMNPKLPLSIGQGQPSTDTVESHQKSAGVAFYKPICNSLQVTGGHQQW